MITRIQNTFILFLITYLILCLQSIDAIVISPKKITIYQSVIKENVSKSIMPPYKNNFPIPYLFSQPTNKQIQVKLDPTNKIQNRRVNVRISQLKYASKINLNLFPDLHQIASLQRMEYRSSDDFSWFGSVNASDNIQAILTVKGNALYGNISIDHQMYQISPVSPPLHEIAMIDYTDFPIEHLPIEKHSSLQKDTSLNNTRYQQGDDGSVIHIMVVYTKKAANESGYIDALIQLAIDETNLSYEQSNVQTRLNLAHVHQVDYNEQDILADLKHLSIQNDGYMDEIHALRDQYCADIVVMLESSNSYCGVSYLNPDADFAFCVVSVKCATGYYSFGHEIGHLFGARHNPEADPKNNPYPYGHGYLHVNGWRTIMAYNNSSLCPNGYCKRILHWSNPGIRFQNMYTGSYSTHNNNRVLNESSVKLANFRHSGNSFTINNNDEHPTKIHSIETSNKWLKIFPEPICPFQVQGLKSKSFKLKVDWQQIESSANGYITINDDKRILISAIPMPSITDMSIEPYEFTCNKNISIKDIHINTSKNIKWRASSKNTWLTIIDGYSGTGKGVVRVRVDKNVMEMREGYVDISAMNLQLHKKVRIIQTGNHLSVEMPLKVCENDGLLPNAGKIFIPSKASKALKVKLSVSDVSEIVLPEYVLIPENEKSICFDVYIQNNTKKDGPHIVNVFADAYGWFTGEISVRVLDDESEGIIYVGKDQSYQTIHSAVEDAAPNSSILVLSGVYNENIRLTRPVHLCAANGPAHTIIQGKDIRNHIIEILHSNIIVEGFTLTGAENSGQAGIYISSEAKNCMIKNNICGQDDLNFNYYGIFLDGGGFHTLSQNLCQHNKRYGIYLNRSNHNTIVKNTCQLNQRTGMNLTQSQHNVIYKNIIKYQPKYGLNLSFNSNHNTMFLNSLISNDCKNVYSQWSINTWHNCAPVNHSFGNSFLGNYFEDHTLEDLNDDGIADTNYQLPNHEESEYPLSKKPEDYESQRQIINQHHQLVSDEMAGISSKCLCVAGKTVLFQSLPDRHGIQKWTGQDAQTGNICFVSPVRQNHEFILQLGKVDSGGAFIQAGQEYSIIGDGKSVNFGFCIFPGEFSIASNEQFAFQMTNESSMDYSIWIGGGHTYISPYRHEQSDILTWTVGKNATFRSIQSALSLLADFQTGKELTLTVQPGTYTENIKINHPVTLIATHGYTQTFIVAKRSDQHVMHIQSDDVRIEGFSIFGANRKNASGICIDRGVANCSIANNRMGYDPSHTNDFGIIIHASIKNSLLQNQCIANEKHGICLDAAFMNQLTDNFCFQNQGSGIYITGSLLNNLTNNTCENNQYDGIHLMKSSRNQLQYNIVTANENNGLYLDSDSFANLIYLNNFVLNQTHNVYSEGINQWSTDTKMTYQYNGNVLTNHMGNYYGDHVGEDKNNNGLIDEIYNNNGMDIADAYALIQSYFFYKYIPHSSTVHMAKTQAFDITKITIESPKNEVQTQKTAAEAIISLPETDPNSVDNMKKPHFFKVDKESKPVKAGHANLPILLFTDVPAYGNRLKNLKGLVLNIEPELYHIAVYIHIKDKGWRSKPYPAAPMTTIQPDGRWECDITTSAFDQNADTIVAVLYVSDIMPPTLMNAPVLPDIIFKKGAGFVQDER